jgi:hypothetical protein
LYGIVAERDVKGDRAKSGVADVPLSWIERADCVYNLTTKQRIKFGRAMNRVNKSEVIEKLTELAKSRRIKPYVGPLKFKKPRFVVRNK